MREDARNAAAAVNQDRLWQRHADMAKIGAIPGNGVNRAALSKEDIVARQLLLSWAKQRGYAIAADGIGNLFIRRAGMDADAAPVMTGSHMDSQPRGGRFDGIYGVLAGFESLEALDEAGVKTRRPIEVVAWTNEEGGRFQPCTMGSMIYAGVTKLDDVLAVTDNDGIRLGDALNETLAATPGLAHRDFGTPPAAYVEAHIEQGPLLENAGKQVGVVTGIQGLRWFNIEIFGRTDHAGTTPVSLRQDAVKEAIACINALTQLAHDPADVIRFTVGRMQVTPNSPNSVASHVLFSVDLRHPDPARVEALGNAVAPLIKQAVKTCTYRITPTLRSDPRVFDTDIVNAVEQSAKALGLANLRLPSGASHDANYAAELGPAGMIFVPCEKGVSHNEAENAKPEDLAAGARVLAATLVELANR